MHHGILGQKWGVRRFQNEDGSLTDAGRKRYGQELYKMIKKNGYASLNVKQEVKKQKLTNYIINDPDYIKSKKKYKDAIKYERIADDYNVEDDKEAMLAMTKLYQRDFGRKPDLNSKDFRDVISYTDDIKPTKAMKEAQEAEDIALNAWSEYRDSLKKSVNKYIGEIGSKKVSDVQSLISEKKSLENAVYDIISNIELEEMYRDK